LRGRHVDALIIGGAQVIDAITACIASSIHIADLDLENQAICSTIAFQVMRNASRV
jgi:hypothetical protein